MTDNEDTKLNGGKHSKLTSSESGSTSSTSLTSSVTSSTSLECPYCGATTRSDGEPFPSFQSLRGHIGGAHKVYLNKSQYDAIVSGEQEAPLPPVRPKKATKKVRIPKTPKGEAATISVVEAEWDPDQRDRITEIEKRRVLNEQESRLLEAELRREQLEDRMDDHTPWDRGRRQWDGRRQRDGGTSSLDREDFKRMGKLEAQVEQHKESEETVSSQGETISELMEQMDAKDKLMFEQMRIQNENLNREKDRAHETQLTLLKQMADDRRASDNRYHESQMKSMEERLTLRMEMQSRNVEERQMDMAEDGVKMMTGAARRLGDELQKVSLGARMASGLAGQAKMQPIEDAPPRESMGPSSVGDMMLAEGNFKQVEIWDEKAGQSRPATFEDTGLQMERRDPRASTVVDDRNVGEEP